ncbi:hypothetical protein CPC08DRAFT_695029 [Agrocybe pediades]|nr:hypothetical protein CPC08DRAFT_695029 [Agrocybe pediades]
MFLQLLDESNLDTYDYRKELYKPNSNKLGLILDAILANEKGKVKLYEWLLPHALDVVCKEVGKEMDATTAAERMPGLASITPEFIENWSVPDYRKIAPCLYTILLAAAETNTAKERNTKKSPTTTCNVIVMQLSYQRSQRSIGFAGLFGLFLWTTGCSKQTIEALHRCGLSVSYVSVLNTIEALAKHCMELAIKVGTDIHVFCYDNVNISTSIFVEQRGSLGPAKVTSGTFGVLYKVRNGNREHMKLAPILQRFRACKGLSFNQDIRPTRAQLASFQNQLAIIVVRALTDHCKDFSHFSAHPDLQHRPRRQIPKGYITEQFPIRSTTIEEATVRGNLLYHDDRLVFQLGPGLFHLCLNLVWAYLHVHRGALHQTGSLTYFFSVMEKARLGGERPDYHTLLASLTQIRDGALLNAWRLECGYESLKKFAKSKPKPEDLLGIAQRIISKYGSLVWASVRQASSRVLTSGRCFAFRILPGDCLFLLPASGIWIRLGSLGSP